MKPSPNPVAPLRFLYVEDSEADYELALRSLRKGGLTVEGNRVESPEAFTAALAHGDYDIILTDYNLRGWTGLDVLRIIAKEHGAVHLPVILISGAIGEEKAVECLRAGADDLLLKDSLARLPLAVRRALDERSNREAAHASQQWIEENEERFRLVVEATNDIIWDWDVVSDKAWISPKLKNVMGYEPSVAAHGADWWWAHVHPADREAARRKFELALHGSQDISTNEYRFQRANGEYAAVQIWCKIVRDATGAPQRVVGAVMDVTEQKLLENRLRQAAKMDAIGQLAGGIAHDFNNILGVIMGNLELIELRSQNPPVVQERLASIKIASHRAAELTKQLLNFSRQQVTDQRLLSINDSIREALRFIDRTIEENIRIAPRLDTSVGAVMADPGQIQQVILNLVLNARDAMPQGGEITIETFPAAIDQGQPTHGAVMPAGNYVVIAVSDNGVGMDEATKQHIFEPFFTTKGSNQGTGLGLASVYGIVKQSNGFIWVYSELGKGTTFKVYLPATTQAPALAANPLSATLATGNETILVVEDQAELLDVMVEVLSDCGYKVIQASDYSTAMASLPADLDSINLLITDVVMPGDKIGAQLAMELIEKCPKLKVIFISGYTSDSKNIRQLMGRGAAFLPKPFTPSQLTSKVRQVLDASH